MRSFDYSSANTLDDVISALGDIAQQNRALAGGTDLLTLMKGDIVQPARLIDIKRVPELASGIDATSDGVTIGALTTLSEIETSQLLQERYPVLTQAASLAATPQLRNMATLGGNLLQRPRCWYYRDEHFNCWLKGGDTCHARDGENHLHAVFDVSPCVAVHPSDLATALVALDAEVRLRGQRGERTLPLTEFFAPPADDRRTENVLGNDEVVLSIRIPETDGSRGSSTYLKAMDRKVWAFALVGVAAVIHQSDGQITDARIVLSGVAPVPWRAETAEQALIGTSGDDAAILHAADAALEDAQPLDRNDYKVALAKSLIRNALRACGL